LVRRLIKLRNLGSGRLFHCRRLLEKGGNMANTCTICRNKSRVQIDSALIKNQPLRDIALRFDVGLMAVQRHQGCIAELIQDTQKARVAYYALNINEELKRCFVRSNRLSDACYEWLTDPESPNEYTPDPRTSEVDGIYEEEDGKYQDGTPRMVRKRGVMADLLAKIEGTGKQGLFVELKIADPRKLILDAAKAIDRSTDRLAKLTGAYQKKQENQPDEQKKHEIIVEAYKRVFRGKTLEQAIALTRAIYDAGNEVAYDAAVRAAIAADTEAVEQVWDQAELHVNGRETIH
jgi:hypothetical protein